MEGGGGDKSQTGPKKSTWRYMGSALVFRAAFTMIADKVDGAANGTHEERTHKGTKIALGAVANVGWN
jgi:hypothetical protein